jgi:hypothetical protein
MIEIVFSFFVFPRERLLPRGGPRNFVCVKNSILNDPIYAQVMLATEDETTFSESKEVLESLCYEGRVLVSSRAVAASAFSNLLFFFEKIRKRL